MDPNNPIVLYDIPSPHPDSAWSPNTWKTRYCLNYKRLYYRTEWVEYPDIKDLYTKLGLPAVPFNDRVSYHCLPVIQDLSTGRIIQDSFAIARYLEETYPSTPRLFPEGTTMLIRSFGMFFGTSIEGVFPMIMSETKLNEASVEFFERTRAVYFGAQKFEDITLRGEARRKALKAVEKGLERVAGFYALNGKGEHVMGETLSYADIMVAALLKWFSLNLPEWEEIKGWSDGRWAKSLALLDERYGQVD